MPKGIFCLEGLWHDDLKQKSSVRPILSMLEINGGIPFIHHDVATVQELEFYLSKWKQARYRSYPILYFAFHGERQSLLIDGQKYRLERLGNLLNGACNGSVFIFASCKTLNRQEAVEDFLIQTGALAVFGYRNRVSWMHSAALEMLILSELQNVSFTSRGMNSLQKRTAIVASAFRNIDYSLIICKSRKNPTHSERS